MSRTVPSAILTALAQPEVHPFHAVELLFDSAPLRLWTGFGDLTIDGNVFTGAGNLLSLGGLAESGDLRAVGAQITLSGISSEIVALALAEPYQRRPLRVLFGVVGVAEAVEVFGGLMNTMTIEDSSETSEINLLVDSKLVELERAKVRRNTNESQQALYPGDTGLSFVADLADKEIAWGRKG